MQVVITSVGQGHWVRDVGSRSSIQRYEGGLSESFVLNTPSKELRTMYGVCGFLKIHFAMFV